MVINLLRPPLGLLIVGAPISIIESNRELSLNINKKRNPIKRIPFIYHRAPSPVSTTHTVRSSIFISSEKD